MKHPIWRCQHCGERLYEHIDGRYQCPNCGQRYDAVDYGTATA
ncbi:hypothetical protein [Haloterrigena alkaliphila]|nr:hypothetical protein [Haloterrigena alkaliphila]